MKIDFTALTQQTDAIYQATQKIIDGLEPNQRKTSKEIVELVVAETGAKSSIASGYVSMYLAHSKEVKGRSGAFGGWFKLATPIISSKINIAPYEETDNQPSSSMIEDDEEMEN